MMPDDELSTWNEIRILAVGLLSRGKMASILITPRSRIKSEVDAALVSSRLGSNFFGHYSTVQYE